MASVAPFFRKRDFWACNFELKQSRVDVHTKSGQGIAIGYALVRFEYGVGVVVAVQNVHQVGAVAWDICL